MHSHGKASNLLSLLVITICMSPSSPPHTLGIHIVLIQHKRVTGKLLANNGAEVTGMPNILY